MLYALAKDESVFLDDVSQAILVAPCAKMETQAGKSASTHYKQVQTMSDLLGVHASKGQSWDKIRSMICSNLAQEWCKQDQMWDQELYSDKALKHMLQNGLEGRFQEYADYYAKGKNFKIGADIPIHNIY